MICQSPTMNHVHFYSEKDNDISLVCMLRSLCLKSVSKCKTEGCQQYNLYHQFHYYHKSGYVDMRLRFSREA